MLHHPALIGAPRPIAPRAFFEKHCADLLRIRSDECEKLSGVYAFELAGDGGGSWSVSLRDRSVTCGIAGASVVVIAMSAVDFQSMLLGKLDVRRALATGRIAV